MKCPNCNRELEHVDFKSKGLMGAEGCKHCGGWWVTEAEMHTLEPDVWDNLEAMGVEVSEALSERICPACSVQCAEVTLRYDPTLRVDRCPSCHGLWLDKGELEAMYKDMVAYGEARGTLEHRPADWSAIHWTAYCLGRQWSRTHAGFGAE